MQAIWLMSGSPRRRQLLAAAGFDVHTHVPNADETWPGGDPEAAAVEIARRKLAKAPESVLAAPDIPRLAADTVVVHDDTPLHKPRDEKEARAMLRLLSGSTHRVVTGFALWCGGREHGQAVTTRVRFLHLDDTVIERYVQTGEPMDKAGSYAIQGEGGALVDIIHGSYTNVVGLPLAEVLAALRDQKGAA